MKFTGKKQGLVTRSTLQVPCGGNNCDPSGCGGSGTQQVRSSEPVPGAQGEKREAHLALHSGLKSCL